MDDSKNVLKVYYKAFLKYLIEKTSQDANILTINNCDIINFHSYIENIKNLNVTIKLLKTITINSGN